MVSDEEANRVVIELPALVATRLRVLLAGEGRRRKVTRGMIEAEVVRRLRVSFAIDDLVSEWGHG